MPTSAPTPHDLYSQRHAHHTLALTSAERLSLRLSLARVIVFVLTAALWAASAMYGSWTAGLVGAFGTLAFVGLVVAHTRVELRATQARLGRLFCEQGSARIARDFSVLASRGQPVDASAPAYVTDLDLVGAASLLQLLDTMATPASEERLTTWMLADTSLEATEKRQVAVQEIATLTDLRERLFVLAQTAPSRPETRQSLLAWCQTPPATNMSLATLIAAALLMLTTPTLLLVGPRLGVPTGLWSVAFLVGLAWNRHTFARHHQAFASAQSGGNLVRAEGAVLDLVAHHPWTSPLLQEIASRLPPREGLRRLGLLADLAETRQNGFFQVFAAPFLAFDVWLAEALRRWQATYGSHAAAWFEALADIQALAGLGTFAFENPSYCFPALAETTTTFTAQQLSHPLLPAEHRIANDITVTAAGTALLVTGSNMSGKSTLLRAMGLAIVLGRMGAPVAAHDLRLSRLRLYTSMRVRDSLASGVSHFYAELLALRQVVEATDRGEPVFFLLDEILHGTNSRERVSGAKQVLRYLLDHGATGAVSTHDTSLAELVDETHGHVRPVHLREQTNGETMTFDYQLREGVVQSGNALKLMRNLGLPVELLSP